MSTSWSIANQIARSFVVWVVVHLLEENLLAISVDSVCGTASKAIF